MVVNGRLFKRMKRRVTADVHDFFTFPSHALSSSRDPTPFRTNVRAFLSKHALLPPPSSLLPHLMTWQVLFRVGDAFDLPVCLDVVEEDVARSRSVYCDQCRVVGWSCHPVCAKRFHFIIKANGHSIGGYNKPCTRCGDLLHLSEVRCKSCNNVMTTDDVEDWIYQQLEDTTHLLHGVIHANGYGHLLRVNGREGGSKVLSGCHIMDFWDRLCKSLGVRKVSVMDVSKKYGMEYRLLHAITNGRPWYGDWGYEFRAGSFALTADAYKSAVGTLSTIPLSTFVTEGQKPHTYLEDIISLYKSLSETDLVNIGDLFRFLMNLIHDAHKASTRIGDILHCKKPRLSAPGKNISWTDADAQRVEFAMFRVLRAVSGSNWVNFRALKGAVFKVGPSELLDHCLKELEGKQASNGMVIVARTHPCTGASEYRLEQRDASAAEEQIFHKTLKPTYPTEDVLMRDLKFLYDFLIHPQSMMKYVPDSVRCPAIAAAEKLLDCKQFMKNYAYDDQVSVNMRYMCVSCKIELLENLNDSNYPSIPAELLVLPHNATLSDLKLEGSKAFQDVYLALRRFHIEEVIGASGVDDSTQLKHLVGTIGPVVRVQGRCLGKNGMNKFRMERGVERWTVDCGCGARDDDGERMLACDVCGVWRHTRCSGINDCDAVPARFVCYRCRMSGGSMRQCKVEAVGVGNEYASTME